MQAPKRLNPDVAVGAAYPEINSKFGSSDPRINSKLDSFDFQINPELGTFRSALPRARKAAGVAAGHGNASMSNVGQSAFGLK